MNSLSQKQKEKLPTQILNLLEQEDLELVEIFQLPDTKRRRFYNLRVRSVEYASDLVLKIFGRGEPGVVKALDKEIGFLRLVQDFASTDLHMHVPRFICEGREPQPWYLRTCVEGSFLGDICSDFGIRKEFLTRELAEFFLHFLSSLHSFLEANEGSPFWDSLSTHGYDWYEKDCEYYRRHNESVSSSELDNISRFLSGVSGVLDAQAKVLVHGDLYLKNIFWDGRAEAPGKLSVTDWELLHIGNCAFDVGFIAALAWRDPVWKNMLIDEFEGTLMGERCGAFRTLLDAVTLSVSLRFIRHSEIMETIVEGKALENANLAKEAHLESLRNVLARVT
ncbi:MAG: phosphotransferase family protein [Patescibacteria group bacterium]